MLHCFPCSIAEERVAEPRHLLLEPAANLVDPAGTRPRHALLRHLVPLERVEVRREQLRCSSSRSRSPSRSRGRSSARRRRPPAGVGELQLEHARTASRPRPRNGAGAASHGFVPSRRSNAATITSAFAIQTPAARRRAAAATSRSLRRRRTRGSSGWRSAPKSFERQPTRREDAAAHLAERLAAEDDLVAVLEERPLAAVLERGPARLPFHVSSIRLPSLPRSAPEIVPDAIRSPVRTLAPFDVACASCCGIVQ